MAVEREVEWLLREKYKGKETPEFKVDIRRLEAGEHIAYVIGFVEFLGAKIDLSLRPMIPRPETEYWVEKAIAELKGKSEELRVMDTFAGSGCVGISVLRHVPEANVEFLERDKKLLSQIKNNLEINRIHPKRAKIYHSDVFSAASGSYDAILANPPYVHEEGLTAEAKRELSVEPRKALYAKDWGFFYVQKVLEESPKLLQEGGVLYCEVGEEQEKRVFQFKSLYREFEIRHDQYSKPRYVRAIC